MGMRPDYDYSKPLPEKYEAMMPANKISSYEKYQWREHKVNELYMNGLAVINENNEYVILDDEASENSDVNDEVETVDTDDAEEFTENNAEDDDSEEVDDTDDVDDVVIKSKPKSKPAKSSIKKKKSVKSSKNIVSNDLEFINNMPKSVMDALRKTFISNASKADLISAAVYIFTKGDCEISDKAMALVEQYDSNNQLDSIEDRLSRVERYCKRILDLGYSTELAACYTAFDRRYGATAPRTGPKTHEFREPENLDMLERLREQAQDQRHIDELKIGREIYDQIKDKK